MSIVGKKIYAGNAKIYKSIWDKRGCKQYFSQDPIYTVISEHGNNLCVRHHSLNEGITGWFKKDDVCVIQLCLESHLLTLIYGIGSKL